MVDNDPSNRAGRSDRESQAGNLPLTDPENLLRRNLLRDIQISGADSMESAGLIRDDNESNLIQIGKILLSVSLKPGEA